MKSYSQRKNERLLREFIGPQGQIDPMAMPSQQQNPMMGQQQNPMAMPSQQQNPMMGQQQNPMMGQQQNPMMGQQQNPMMGQDMGDMSGAMGGDDQQSPDNPTNPADSLPSQANQLLRLLSGKSAQQIIDAQQKLNAAIQKMLTGKSKSAGKKGLWQQFQQSKDAKANWGKPGKTAP